MSVERKYRFSATVPYGFASKVSKSQSIATVPNGFAVGSPQNPKNL